MDSPPAWGRLGDADGPNGLLLDGNTFYIVVGEGDLYVNGTVPGTTVISSKGISSPIFDTLIQVTFPQSVDRFASPFTLKIADHTTLLDGSTVTLTNSAGDKATATLISEFRFRPDAREVSSTPTPSESRGWIRIRDRLCGRRGSQPGAPGRYRDRTKNARWCSSQVFRISAARRRRWWMRCRTVFAHTAISCW